MNTISTIKKLTASSVIAGALGLGALGLGSGFAAAAPSTHSGSDTTTTWDTGSETGPNTATGDTSTSDLSDPSSTSHKVEPAEHGLFPTQAQPHSDHAGQGHKGLNEPVAPVEGIRDPFPSASASASDDSSTSSNKSQPEEHELFPVQNGDV
jgi:hypothetical protein